MKGPLRTEAGKLSGFRVNKREAAVLEFSKQLASVLYDYSADGGAIGT